MNPLKFFKQAIHDEEKHELTSSNQGYLYCLYNSVFSKYGEHVYKLGRTNHLETRLKHYTTSYIEPSKFLYTTNLLSDSIKCERILFFLLRKYRVRAQREFFNLELNVIIETIQKIELLTDRQIDRIYSRILSKICPDNILSKLEFLNDEQYLKFLDFDYSIIDEYLEKFRYRPKSKSQLINYVSSEELELSTLMYTNDSIEDDTIELNNEIKEKLII